jgi:cyclohexadieny/prephenate dehydrogenase
MPVYQRMAVIGIGLIGSSVARAARATQAVGEIVAYDADPVVRARVLELGVVDRAEADLAKAVEGADLVVLATPVGAIGEVAASLAPFLAPGATLTDVGSCKAVVAEAFTKLGRDDIHAIPGHPVAGTEKSGPDAGFAELFHNRWVILCPTAATDPAGLAQLTAFWTRLGAKVESMDAAHHDLVLAVTSHLPHLIAYNIVGTAADMETVTQAEVMKFSAGGFRDFTRIAASDPTMWRDVFLNNKGAVLEILARFTEDLHMLSRAIRWGEGDKLHELFTRTREIRQGVIAAGQEVAEPNFGRDRKA